MLEELVPNKVYYKIFHKQNSNSTGRYNINRPDANIAEIESNIQIINNEMDANAIKFLNQVHGNNVINSTRENSTKREEADGQITTETDLALAISTADCVPILLSTRDGEIIAALHAGWRSAKAGIISKASAMIRSQSNKDILAIIGPSISQESYEVDAEYLESFINEDMEFDKLFRTSNRVSHYLFDLAGFVKTQLKKENIILVKHIEEDTYSMDDKYPSYRRSYHKGKPYNENILSVIVKK